MLSLFGLSSLRRTIKHYENATAREIQQLSRHLAEQMELTAKINAPWTDRTGSARRTLQGFAGLIDENIYIGVAGNMPYSPDLEYGYREKYAILRPTVTWYSVGVVQQLAEIIYDLNLHLEVNDDE